MSDRTACVSWPNAATSTIRLVTQTQAPPTWSRTLGSQGHGVLQLCPAESLEGQGPGGRGHNRCFWVWQGGPASTLPSGEDVGQWPVSRGRGHSHAGERRAAGPGAFPATARESRALGEAARLRTERAPCGWEWQGILSSTRGISALPWRWGGCRPQRLQSISAQREACTESGLERPTGGIHHGGQRGEVEVPTAAQGGQTYRPLLWGPCSEREPTTPGDAGVPEPAPAQHD